jgi:penicillin-binding protein 1A
VEIWSRFMRGAHQGVPVAALPCPPAGGVLSGLFNNNAPASAPATDGIAPVPPAPIQAAGNSPSARGAGLDDWLLDNLFGRSRN